MATAPQVASRNRVADEAHEKAKVPSLSLVNVEIFGVQSVLRKNPDRKAFIKNFDFCRRLGADSNSVAHHHDLINLSRYHHHRACLMITESHFVLVSRIQCQYRHRFALSQGKARNAEAP